MGSDRIGTKLNTRMGFRYEFVQYKIEKSAVHFDANFPEWKPAFSEHCHLPTVLIPSFADKIGPIVEPHGLSFLTPNSYRSREGRMELVQIPFLHVCGVTA